jgi:4-hydroxy-tetrahydrodipicolinate synthase
MRTPFTGVGTALITPFTNGGALDEAAVKRLAKRQIDAGVHFLVPCGTTGESPTLTHREKLRVVELVVEEAAGKVPVMAGAGGYDTREAVELSRDMEKVGADGLLQVSPYYNKPTQEGQYQHFKAIAESTRLPILLYSIQGRTGVNIDVATVLRLAQIPNIVGIKEASGSLVQMTDIVANAPEEFLLLSGDDPITVPVMVQVVELCEKGDFAAARKLQGWLLPLLTGNFVESNPAPCKAAMAAMGLCEDELRLPLVSVTPASRERVLGVLQKLRLLGAAARV